MVQPPSSTTAFLWLTLPSERVAHIACLSLHSTRNGDDAALPSVQIVGNAIVQAGSSAAMFVQAGLLEAISDCLGQTAPSTTVRAGSDEREIAVDVASAPKLGLRLLADENDVGAQVIAVNPGSLAANASLYISPGRTNNAALFVVDANYVAGACPRPPY